MFVCMYISNKLQYQLMFFAGLYRVSLFLFQYNALSHCFSSLLVSLFVLVLADIEYQISF